jgi:hypothetical protein
MSLAEIASQSEGLESLVALIGFMVVVLIIDRVFLSKALDQE